MTTVDRPFIPVAKPLVGEAEKRAVMEVLDSGQLAMGSRTEAFEKAFAEYVGAKHAIGVNSGTAALIVALQAHGVGPGDEVITTPFSFIATATSIIACGATPVFVDIDPFDLNLDPNQLEDAITDQTKAVMPVHLYGHPARIAEIQEICDDNGLALVEDAAQAHGAEHAGKRVGTFGTGCFSFYPTKNMTTGEGGIITTNDNEIARLCRIIRSHGQEVRYKHDYFGLNWRMQDMNAARSGTKPASRTPKSWLASSGPSRLPACAMATATSSTSSPSASPAIATPSSSSSMKPVSVVPCTIPSRFTSSRSCARWASAKARSRWPRRPPSTCSHCRFTLLSVPKTSSTSPPR